MIAPPAAAYLLTDRLSRLLIISSIIAMLSSVGGFYLALDLDIAPTGPIASAAGAVFLLIFAFAPRRGFLAAWAVRSRQRQDTIDCLILEFISRQSANHDTSQQPAEVLALPPQKIRRRIARLLERRLIRQSGDHFALTEAGASQLALRTQF